ncbi:3-deoxy-7-phosphoheptulonate synthase [Streptomyces sp. CBMA152]|uniref:3-deoxy-7-phosphoheptulonate synthase n=1 Tax=Streptomyces sp. CBMA152 TaxID=1896312 RepID=UPI002948C213|nr:3-deoxy-7-phosphoheptulonate synthase [Streptomyces sp. CBMA152]
MSITTEARRPDTTLLPLPARERDSLAELPAGQQPSWADAELLAKVRGELADSAPLVPAHETVRLRALLAEVALGRALVVQAGDCAEDPADRTQEAVDRKAGLIDCLAGILQARAGLPVLRVGRIAGQYAKPRSQPVEQRDGVELPVFRGPLVNAPGFDPYERRHDPLRMLDCHQAAASVLDRLHDRHDTRPGGTPVWTSHEALVLDYELPQLRRDAYNRTFLTSTHWPWIGERTRQLDGAHVELMSRIANPVSCKVGPTMTVDELLALCARLDPNRQPGRLTLIARLGADVVSERLPALVAAVRDAGHPVSWLCDPMHANTYTDRGGRKTRSVATVIDELQRFHTAVTQEGGTAGGLHLEATPEPVAECVADSEPLASGAYTTLCDPRLNLQQAIAVANAWPQQAS